MAKKEPTEKAKEAAKRKKKIVAKVTKAEKLAKEVKAALEEAGYEFLSFPSNEYRREFMEKNGYNPDAVFLATLQAAELDEGWRDKIIPAPIAASEKGPGGGGPRGEGKG